MMRLDLVTETYLPEVNGVAMTLGRLVKELGERGFDIQIVRPRQHEEILSETDSSCDGWPVMRIKGLPLPGYQGIRFGLPCRRVFKKKWRRSRPDLVYVATEGPLGWSAISVAESMDIPVISGFHTNFHTYSSHYRVPFMERLILGYLRWLHNRTAATLVPVESLQKSLTEKGFRSVSVFGRGVCTQQFHPSRRKEQLRASWGLQPDQLAVIYVGRVAPEKNMELAIAAFEKIKSIRKDARYIVVGDGPSLSSLQKRHPDFIYCGTQRGDELAEHYASADLFLFSSMSETYGNVVPEAMASGLPVVAFDYAAPSRLIQPGTNGFLVPMGDEAAFVDEAVRVAGFAFDDARKRVGQTAAQSMVAFSWKQEIDRFMEVVARLLPSKRSGANLSSRVSVQDSQNTQDAQQSHKAQNPQNAEMTSV
jgi:glycosyltransferase involved in cell wall biosynthesis